MFLLRLLLLSSMDSGVHNLAFMVVFFLGHIENVCAVKVCFFFAMLSCLWSIIQDAENLTKSRRSFLSSFDNFSLLFAGKFWCYTNRSLWKEIAARWKSLTSLALFRVVKGISSFLSKKSLHVDSESSSQNVNDKLLWGFISLFGLWRRHV